jgi:hypothetical protein
MKKIAFLLFGICLGMTVFCQQPTKSKLEFDKNKPVYTVEASCGICQFKMKGDECALAIKYEGNYYYVDGTSIDDHGNAHNKHGFCNAVRKAKVQGEIAGDKFHVTWFELEKTKNK